MDLDIVQSQIDIVAAIEITGAGLVMADLDLPAILHGFPIAQPIPQEYFLLVPKEFLRDIGDADKVEHEPPLLEGTGQMQRLRMMLGCLNL